MCVININLDVINGVPIQSTVNGRYRTPQGTGTWVTFTTNTTSPKTPDITVLGAYDLEVQVTSSEAGNLVSNWAAATFVVASSCDGSSSINLGYDSTYTIAACSATPSQYFILSGESFPNLTAIWTNSNLTTKAPAGYYSFNGNVVYFDGNVTVGPSAVCTSSTLITGLGYDFSSSIIACDQTTLRNVYVLSPHNFYTATAFFTDSNLTIKADSGEYSNGADARLWDNFQEILGPAYTCTQYINTNLTYSTSGSTPCTGPVSEYFVLGDVFSGNPQGIYLNEQGSPAPTGFYSTGSNFRYWDQASQSLGNYIACSSENCYLISPVRFEPGVDGGGPGSCLPQDTPSIYANSLDFNEITKVAIDGNCTLKPEAGYIISGTLWKYWNGTAITNSGTC